MLRVVQSPTAADRVAAAAEFIRSFAGATEFLVVGSSREAVDDLVRGLAHDIGATFGLHRFSFTQLAARLAIGKLAAAGVAPSSAVGAEAMAVRAAYEAAMRNELPYFAPVTKFPGFAHATAATIGDLRAAGKRCGGDHGIWEDRNEEGDAASVALPRRMVTHHPISQLGWTRPLIHAPGADLVSRIPEIFGCTAVRSHLGLSGIGRGY
jgi:hypothetical protein